MKAVIALAAGLTLSFAASATPTRPWTEAEIARVDGYTYRSDDTPLDALPEKFRGKDGVKGYSMSIDVHRLADPPLRPEFSSIAAQKLHDALCRMDTLALARVREPLSRLNATRTMIYTKVDIELIEVFKSSTGLRPGDLLPLVRVGGEVQYGDQRLRVLDDDNRPFADDGVYLLRLSAPDASGLVREVDRYNIAVRKGLLRPDHGWWFTIYPGQPYDSARDNLQQLLSMPCR